MRRSPAPQVKLPPSLEAIQLAQQPVAQLTSNATASASAWVNEQLVAVNQGGWAIKTTYIFIYWYIDIEGEWLSESGKKEERMSTIRAEEVGSKYKFCANAPAWARDLPDHFE